MHSWDVTGKEEEKPLTRHCLKCGKEQKLYHLLHDGLEYYFYDRIDKPQKTHKQIKREEKTNFIIIILYFSFLLEGWFLFIYNEPISIYKFLFVMVILSSSMMIIFEIFWRTMKEYAIPVEKENRLREIYKPKEQKNYRDARSNAETKLMHRFALGEISEEEFTSRMARLI